MDKGRLVFLSRFATQTRVRIGQLLLWRPAFLAVRREHRPQPSVGHASAFVCVCVC